MFYDDKKILNPIMEFRLFLNLGKLSSNLAIFCLILMEGLMYLCGGSGVIEFDR